MLAQDCILLKPNMILPGALAGLSRLCAAAACQWQTPLWLLMRDLAPVAGMASAQIELHIPDIPCGRT